MNDFEKELLADLQDRETRRVKAEEYLLERVSKLENSKQPVNYPDASKHQIVSFIKSGVRILGYCFIPFNLIVSASLLILSEIVGIIEELV